MPTYIYRGLDNPPTQAKPANLTETAAASAPAPAGSAGTTTAPTGSPSTASGVVILPSATLPKANPWLEHIEDASDIMAESIPEVEQIVEGIVASQSKLAIASGAKSFKTYLTIDMVLSVSHGVPWLGRKTIRKRVLYVDLELKGETFKRRIQAIASARGITIEPGWFFHLSLRGRMSGVLATELVSRIIQVVTKHDIGVVVLDPVFKANTEGDENSSRDQTVFLNELDRITTEAKCTLVLNDHFAKGNMSDRDPLDTIRGSSAKMGDLDAAMILRKHQEEDCFRVDMIHRELPGVRPFCIGWHYPLMELRPNLDPDTMRRPQSGRSKAHDLPELLSFIRDTSAASPISISAWAKSAGIARSTLTGYLPTLRAKGWVRTAGEGATSGGQFITSSGLESLTKESV
jgi:hypothetical protein